LHLDQGTPDRPAPGPEGHRVNESVRHRDFAFAEYARYPKDDFFFRTEMPGLKANLLQEPIVALCQLQMLDSALSKGFKQLWR